MDRAASGAGGAADADDAAGDVVGTDSLSSPAEAKEGSAAEV